ncbi:SitI6 family double-CXXCG motif immunity protein [Corallococcus exiguus]|uniref:SitI6 family double-CXXCG motif immunity protein n=1 Tax=Corallococcus exiguus TaxID=83462 RepID=UPI001494A509|nr:double-CXXCG motif protein [Corallococcus exiguus]NPD22838.1 hypothetical protein [Corallococcus exiguus]
MRYFSVDSLNFDESGMWSGEYRARHRWHLPGVECPRCGTWSGSGAYPSVDLSSLSEPALDEVRGPTNFEEYRRLVALVRPLLPADVPVKGGTSFGPMRGTAQGRFGPVTCYPPWELVLREDVVELLKSKGLQGIIAVRMEFRSRRSTMPALYEVEARPLAKLHPDCIGEFKTPPCSVCGRPESYSLPPKRWLLRSAVPEGLDVFGIAGARLRVVSERFVETVQRLGPSDVHYQELPVG